MIENLPVPGDGFFCKFQIGLVIADLHRQFVGFSLEPGGIEIFHLDISNHLLINARRSEHDMGADFTDILLGGLRFFREIEGEPGLNPAGDRHHLLPDPGKGEVGDKIICFKVGIDPHQILAHGEHIIMGEKGSFRKGGRSRGIEEKTDIVSFSLRDRDLRRDPGSFLSSSSPIFITSLRLMRMGSS